MKLFLIIFFILLCGVGIAFGMHQDPGYVLIAYNHTTLEMTLWFGLIAFILALVVIRFIWFILSRIICFPSHLRTQRKKNASLKGQCLLQEALIASVDGDYQKAIQTFKKSEHYDNHSLIAYLGGAFALHSQSNIEASELLLKKALEKFSGSAQTIYYMQAQLHVISGCYEKALETLHTMDKKNSSQDLWITLMMRCYLGLSQWEAAYALYTQFAKIKSLKACEIESAYQTIIIGCLGSYDANNLANFWASLPKPERQKESYVWLLADRFMESNQYDCAAEAIMQSLKTEFSEDLWELLVSCVPHQHRSIATFCKKQARLHSDQWIISYCAGLCSLEEGNLTQATDFFTQSIALHPTEQALLGLANLYHQQDLEKDFHQTCLQLISLHHSEEAP
jgi:HemY protein